MGQLALDRSQGGLGRGGGVLGPDLGLVDRSRSRDGRLELSMQRTLGGRQTVFVGLDGGHGGVDVADGRVLVLLVQASGVRGRRKHRAHGRGRFVGHVGVDRVDEKFAARRLVVDLVGGQLGPDLGQMGLDLVEMDGRLVVFFGQRGHLLLLLADLGLEGGHLGLGPGHRWGIRGPAGADPPDAAVAGTAGTARAATRASAPAAPRPEGSGPARRGPPASHTSHFDHSSQTVWPSEGRAGPVSAGQDLTRLLTR